VPRAATDWTAAHAHGRAARAPGGRPLVHHCHRPRSAPDPQGTLAAGRAVRPGDAVGGAPVARLCGDRRPRREVSHHAGHARSGAAGGGEPDRSSGTVAGRSAAEAIASGRACPSRHCAMTLLGGAGPRARRGARRSIIGGSALRTTRGAAGRRVSVSLVYAGWVIPHPRHGRRGRTRTGDRPRRSARCAAPCPLHPGSGWARLVGCTRLDQAGQMQPLADWLPD
jgi:hypothetical protein